MDQPVIVCNFPSPSKTSRTVAPASLGLRRVAQRVRKQGTDDVNGVLRAADGDESADGPAILLFAGLLVAVIKDIVRDQGG